MQTKPGDVVLIYHRDKPQGYARVEEITADVKPGWWQIRLKLLTVPLQEITWILRDEYIDGGEFTMGGEPLRMELLPPPRSLTPVEDQAAPDEPAGGDGAGDDEPGGKDGKGGEKVVSLLDRRRKD